jgi:SAM-dependent methyltransferase
LEVGFGAGTDFIQWLRVGAQVSGIDLTPEALQNVTNRVKVYELPPPESIQVADAENLPFPSGTFDLGYSFGVLHHTPDTMRAIGELTRVVKPGGDIKIMLYNRHSIWCLNLWIRYALLRGRPWKPFAWTLWNFNESVGTKAFTRRELREMLSQVGWEDVHVRTEVTSADYLGASAFPPLNWFYRIAIRLAGVRECWRPRYYASRVNDPITGRQPTERERPKGNFFSGNPLGLYHCISAKKRG